MCFPTLTLCMRPSAVVRALPLVHRREARPCVHAHGGLHALQVLQRLVPVHRGIFEDYVANFWCATHPLVKWKRLFPQQALVRMALGGTVAAFTPACAHQVVRPSRVGFLYCLTNTAFAFFMFSYQVQRPSSLNEQMIDALPCPVCGAAHAATAPDSRVRAANVSDFTRSHIAIYMWLFWRHCGHPSTASQIHRSVTIAVLRLLHRHHAWLHPYTPCSLT